MLLDFPILRLNLNNSVKTGQFTIYLLTRSKLSMFNFCHRHQLKTCELINSAFPLHKSLR